MHDFLHNEIKIGDHVVGMFHSRTSSDLKIGEIVNITPKMVDLKLMRSDGSFEKTTKRISLYKIIKIQHKVILCKDCEYYQMDPESKVMNCTGPMAYANTPPDWFCKSAVAKLTCKY